MFDTSDGTLACDGETCRDPEKKRARMTTKTQAAILSRQLKALRELAIGAGWALTELADFCPSCLVEQVERRKREEAEAREAQARREALARL